MCGGLLVTFFHLHCYITVLGCADIKHFRWNEICKDGRFNSGHINEIFMHRGHMKCIKNAFQ